MQDTRTSMASDATAPFDCHLTELDDDRLAELSRQWHVRALQGDEAAHRVAQVLEAEECRRERSTPRDLDWPAPQLPRATPWSRWWASVQPSRADG